MVRASRDFDTEKTENSGLKVMIETKDGEIFMEYTETLMKVRFPSEGYIMKVVWAENRVNARINAASDSIHGIYEGFEYNVRVNKGNAENIKNGYIIRAENCEIEIKLG